MVNFDDGAASVECYGQASGHRCREGKKSHGGDEKRGKVGLEQVRSIGVVALITGVMQRTKQKYGERAYRSIRLDLGHMTQNLCLAGATLDLAVITIGGFIGDLGNELLQIDGVDEALLDIACIGRAGSPARRDIASKEGP